MSLSEKQLAQRLINLEEKFNILVANLKKVASHLVALNSLKEKSKEFDGLLAKVSQLEEELNNQKVLTKKVEKLKQNLDKLKESLESVKSELKTVSIKGVATSQVKAKDDVKEVKSDSHKKETEYVQKIKQVTTTQVTIEAEELEGETTKDLNLSMDKLLRLMIKHRASDLHIKAGIRPTLRIDGDLIPVGKIPLKKGDCKVIISEILNSRRLEKLITYGNVDFGLKIDKNNFRVNIFREKGNMSAAIRLLSTKVPTVKELHLPPVINSLTEYENGLIIVTGPTGSGKSTTLATMVEYINHNRNSHIITIEDPIEFFYDDINSIITQREVGTDTLSFSDALRESLRQDPDIILIGEMRDKETMLSAINAAETGHLVLTTLHTSNSIQTVSRIIDSFKGEDQRQVRMMLANTLRAVISQKLIKRVDKDGRVPAVEIMIVTPTIKSLILEEKIDDAYAYIREGQLDGMQTFTQSLISLYKNGLISKEDALYYADRPDEIRLELSAMKLRGELDEDNIEEEFGDWN